MGETCLRGACLRAVCIGLGILLSLAPLSAAAEPELPPEKTPREVTVPEASIPGGDALLPTDSPEADSRSVTARTAAPLGEKWAAFEQRAIAGDSPPVLPVTEKVAQGASGILLKLLLYLLVLGGLFWLGLVALKRYVPGGRQLFASPAMEVLGRSHIDPRRYVALVRVGRRLLVVGVGPDSMAPLSEIGDAEEVAELLAVARPKTEGGRSLFQNLFRQYLDRSDAEADAVIAERTSEGLADSFSDLQARVREIHRRE